MSPRELQTLIQATPACAASAHTNEMPKIGADEARAKDQAVADALNAAGAGMELRSRLIGYGAVLAELGPVAGAAVLDKLDAAAAQSSPLKWAMKLLDTGTLDIGVPVTQAQIQAMRGGLLTDAEADALQRMGMEPIIVSSQQVSNALRGPWGDE